MRGVARVSGRAGYPLPASNAARGFGSAYTARVHNRPRKRPVAWPVITPSRCTGCGWCVAACPDHLLVLEVQARKKSAQLALPELCSGCAKCIPVCNFGAIEMTRVAIRSID